MLLTLSSTVFSYPDMNGTGDINDTNDTPFVNLQYTKEDSGFQRKKKKTTPGRVSKGTQALKYIGNWFHNMSLQMYIMVRN